MDAVIAVIIIASSMVLFVGLQSNTSISSSQTTTIVEDSLFVLENTGYLIQTIDTNSPTQAAFAIRQQIESYLPNNFDARVQVSQYSIESGQCAAQQTFSACFPDSNKVTGVSGGTAPDEFVSGKKFFLRKQPPGDCNISYAEFAGAKEVIEWIPKKKETEAAYFSDPYIDLIFPEEILNWIFENKQINKQNSIEAFFAEDLIEFDFNVSVEPSDFITCDENVTVTLTIETENSLRLPIDMIIVMDRSRPENAYLIDKNVMVTFLNNALWQNEDAIGIASFDDSGHKDQSLSSNRIAVANKITNLKREAGEINNAIAEGIEKANELLTPGPGTTARESSVKFEIVLSDRQDNSNTTDIETVAQYAADNNITIFSVGVGNNIDETELMLLADTTGGEYYWAEDANSLQGLYDIIANRIDMFALDSNVYIPVTTGTEIIDLNGGNIIDTNIVYVTGSTGSSTIFIIQYIVNFPCTNVNICGLETLTFPEPGTTFNYIDSDGDLHVIDFNASVTLEFKVRDLTVDIVAGK